MEFFEKTGIKESAFSKWQNTTNPSSGKIAPVCKAFSVIFEWLLSGIDAMGKRVKNMEYIVEKGTDRRKLIAFFIDLDQSFCECTPGYVEAFLSL